MEIKCNFCGSTHVEEGVSIGQDTETGNIGPNYMHGILINTLQMYADLCLDCGTLSRLYIKDLTPRTWHKKPGSFGSK